MALILLVDDDANNRDVCRVLLEHRGHACHEAADGLSAFHLAVALVRDVILMDIGMPVMSGWAAISLLKSNPATSRVPVVALTALSLGADEARAFRAGFAEYVQKPARPSYIADLVDRLLARGSSADPHVNKVGP